MSRPVLIVGGGPAGLSAAHALASAGQAVELVEKADRLGGTRVLLHTVTMDGPQGVDLLHRLSPRRVVPVHFDDYRVFRAPLHDFVHRAGTAGFGERIVRVDRGDVVALA